MFFWLTLVPREIGLTPSIEICAPVGPTEPVFDSSSGRIDWFIVLYTTVTR